jgi:hypothetical protein
MIIKLIAASLPIALAIGAAIGYRISESERESITQKLNREGAVNAAPMPVKKLDRTELERRFIACIGRNVRLTAYSDADLNNDLSDCERQKKN